MKEAALKEKLADFDGEILCLDNVDSTNKKAAELALAGRESVVAAAKQSAGQGRLGRSFVSGEGGVYVSIGICLNNIFPENEIPDLNRTLHFPLIAALAASDAISYVCEEKLGTTVIPDIKWPNDLQIKGKKIGGILCRAAQNHGKWFFIVGIGVNVFNDLPADLQDASTLTEGLNDICIEDADKDEFLEVLTAAIAADILEYLKKGIKDGGQMLDEVEKRCVTIGKKVEVPERNITGTAIQIGDDGALCIETDDGGYEAVKSGDVIIYKD